MSVAVRTYRYLPGKYMEVVAFEVKPRDAITVTAVYELWRTCAVPRMPT